MNDENRIRKAWFAVHEQGVQKVVGYSCAPNNPNSWWCPQLGFTLQEKYHLFETEKEAIEKALSEIDKLQTELSDKRTKLLQQLKGSPFQKRETNP